MKRLVYILIFGSALLIECQTRKDQAQLLRDVESINLASGEIALCGTGKFGNVSFSAPCKKEVAEDFNLATALLHSFEYAEAEKVFAKVMKRDPECIMAYWGAAMSNFHPLWAPPNPAELEKGSKTIAVARTINTDDDRAKTYLEAIASIFDNWQELDHKTRVLKFEKAAEKIYQMYPDDKESAVFYALALRAAADPADKSFIKQKKAGKILEDLFAKEPDHPGIAHYLIHTYDYPELAEHGLEAARKYAAIASASAHAQHMPSHIFTRLGLWDESIQSNTNSTAAAKCYAENLGKEGHWDQELHGLDYLVYAYLQQGRDEEAKAKVDYVGSIDNVFPITFVDAYTFSATPVRFALERKDWKQAATMALHPQSFPWEKFPWERAVLSFGKAIGAVHLKQNGIAEGALVELKKSYEELVAAKKTYEANQVDIQINATEAWIQYAKGEKNNALTLMQKAASMEDATEKHAVTPGEVIPARALLADLFMEMKEFKNALESYEADLKKHPGRFNDVYGAAEASRLSGDTKKASYYYQQLIDLSKSSNGQRREVQEAQKFLKKYPLS